MDIANIALAIGIIDTIATIALIALVLNMRKKGSTVPGPEKPVLVEDKKETQVPAKDEFHEMVSERFMESMNQHIHKTSGIPEDEVVQMGIPEDEVKIFDLSSKENKEVFAIAAKAFEDKKVEIGPGIDIDSDKSSLTELNVDPETRAKNEAYIIAKRAGQLQPMSEVVVEPFLKAKSKAAE